MNNKANQLVEERGRGQEERSSFDGNLCQVISCNVKGLNCPVKRGDVKWVLRNLLVMLPSFRNLRWKWLVVQEWLVCGIAVKFTGCFCHLWAVQEALPLFETLGFWSLRILKSGLFLCAANLNPCSTVLFGVLLGFMVLMMTR